MAVVTVGPNFRGRKAFCNTCKKYIGAEANEDYCRHSNSTLPGGAQLYVICPKCLNNAYLPSDDSSSYEIFVRNVIEALDAKSRL